MTFKQYKEKILSNPGSENLSFKKDGRYHYVYRVTNLYDDTHYYGSRTSIKPPLEDFWEYGTSSSQIGRKKHIKTCPEEYRLKIIKILDNEADKILWESYLHGHFGVKSNSKFWNRCNQTPFGYIPQIHKNKTNVIDISSGKRYSVNSDFYFQNKNNFKTAMSGKLVVKNKNDGKFYVISTEEYCKNKEEYASPFENKVSVIIDDKIVLISSDEYNKNKEKYICFSEIKKQFIHFQTKEIIYEYEKKVDKTVYTQLNEYMFVTDKNNTIKKIHKDEIKKEHNIYLGFSANAHISLTNDFYVHHSLYNPKIHKHNDKNTIVAKKIGENKFKRIKISDYDSNTYTTPVKGKISVIDKITNTTKSISVEEFKNESRYETLTKGKTQVKDKNGNIIQIDSADYEFYKSKGFKHINKGRSNCINLLTGERYKEEGSVVRITPWLCPKTVIKFYKVDELLFNKGSLEKYLKNKYNISFYKYSKEHKLQVLPFEDVVCNFKKEDFYANK